jgi:Spy/CpxP family protein refolding chaperone
VSATIEASSRPRGWGLWVALALSLTLNLFVLGGLGWSMMNRPLPAPGGPQRFIEIGRSLDLSGDQRAALRDFGAGARELTRGLRDANAPLIHSMWSEMGKPQPDQAAIQTLADQVLDNRRNFQHKMAQNLLAFLAVLTPEQRERFVDRAMEPPDRRRR